MLSNYFKVFVPWPVNGFLVPSKFVVSENTLCSLWFAVNKFVVVAS